MASNDFFMRQVEGFTDMISEFLFDGKASDHIDQVYDTGTSTEAHTLLIDLRFLLSQGYINEAEDLLFRQMEADRDSNYLEASRSFYAWLDETDDDALEKSGYGREEIDEGRMAVEKFYHGRSNQLY